MHINYIDYTLYALTIGICFFGFWRHTKAHQQAADPAPPDLPGPTIVCNRSSYIELLKAYFWQTYMLAYFLSWSCVFYMIAVYFLNISVSPTMRAFCDAIMSHQNPVSVLAALPAMIMISIQCSRRLHDALFLRVYAKPGKINLVHFALVTLHYTISILAIIGASPLFSGTSDSKEIHWSDTGSLKAIIPCTILFIWASYEQQQSTAILTNHTEENHLPRGRLFEYVSNPHRLTEVLIYAAVAFLMQTKTYFLILLWVVSNELQASIETHDSYKDLIRNYNTKYPLETNVYFVTS